MTENWDVIIVGSGNAALSAGISALEAGSKVLIIEKACPDLSGGNTKYTAGAMRFAYDKSEDLLPLLANPNDERIKDTDFGVYDKENFRNDLLQFNDGAPLTDEQNILIDQSYETITWLAGHGITYNPIWSRQSFKKDDKIVFWGGLVLSAENEGVGLFDMELKAFQQLGGIIQYNSKFTDLITESGTIIGVTLSDGSQLHAKAVILACGGFESNQQLRAELLGAEWDNSKVRGTPHNTGEGLIAAWKVGAQKHGHFEGCHATPMDYFMQDYGNLDIPHIERKNYRKISYFLGIMLNEKGARFVDEGSNFRNYTYAQFGKAILQQPNQRAWQIFDSKVFDLLYEEYNFFDAHYEEANTLEELLNKCDGLENAPALNCLQEFNASVDESIHFDPTSKDGKSAKTGTLKKSNWAQKLDSPPYRAYPVTCGITFTYGGVKVSEQAAVLDKDGNVIPGLFACGEMVGGIFLNGYPGGSGLTSGAVFGRLAGKFASQKQ